MFSPNLEFEHGPHPASGATVTRHRPVFLGEALSFLGCATGKNYLDLTLGGGGHAEAILEATSPNGKLIGRDRDARAVERCRERLSRFGDRIKIGKGSLADVETALSEFGNTTVDGALIDCGFSSDQMDDSTRGFSILHEGPLDMRMDTGGGFTAAEWLLSAREPEIADAIYAFGEERFSRRIAKGIVEARRTAKLNTTADLARIVRSAVPAVARYGKIHPATRTFQAIRIVVNDELGQLRKGLQVLLSRLSAGARIVVLTFHSLEDRVPKELFRDAARAGMVRLLIPKPVVPTAEEVRSNPRARSAKLRAVEILRGNA